MAETSVKSAGHTPLPWDTDGEEKYLIYGNTVTGALVARCGGKGFQFVDRSQSEAEANAALIVKAVNSFPALVAALKPFAEAAEGYEELPDKFGFAMSKAGGDLITLGDLRKARSALSEAERAEDKGVE